MQGFTRGTYSVSVVASWTSSKSDLVHGWISDVNECLGLHRLDDGSFNIDHLPSGAALAAALPEGVALAAIHAVEDQDWAWDPRQATDGQRRQLALFVKIVAELRSAAQS